MNVNVRRLLVVALVTGLSVLPVIARADIAVAAASHVSAMPQVPGSVGTSAALPRVLPSSDVSLYKQMFDLGERGQWSRVDSLTPKLTDRLLLGHVKAQRSLHPKAYRSSYPELKAWMAEYADHPDAEEIYALGLRRKPKRGRPHSNARSGTCIDRSGLWRRKQERPRHRDLG